MPTTLREEDDENDWCSLITSFFNAVSVLAVTFLGMSNHICSKGIWEKCHGLLFDCNSQLEVLAQTASAITSNPCGLEILYICPASHEANSLTNILN
mmetsp:Transcript_26676/g.62357  ORF Transcript_26676/g.62357 Transcript_26676/m.62357 type:complete len:97 (+) Transcript_26676:2835-3125(+)